MYMHILRRQSGSMFSFCGVGGVSPAAGTVPSPRRSCPMGPEGSGTGDCRSDFRVRQARMEV